MRIDNTLASRSARHKGRVGTARLDNNSSPVQSTPDASAGSCCMLLLLRRAVVSPPYPVPHRFKSVYTGTSPLRQASWLTGSADQSMRATAPVSVVRGLMPHMRQLCEQR